jgi:tetratricopeptide (TPR) repeat protein
MNQPLESTAAATSKPRLILAAGMAALAICVALASAPILRSQEADAYTRAVDRYQAGDYEGAWQLVSSPLVRIRTPAAHTLRGVLLSIRSEWSAAEAEFEQAITLDEADHRAWFNRGHVAHWFHDDPMRALEYYDRAAQLAPEEAEYRLYLGRTLVKVWRLAEADRQYAVLLRLRPHQVALYKEAADVRMRMNDPDGASELLNEATARNPTSAAAFVHLGDHQFGIPAYAQAAISYRRAAQLEPHSLKAWSQAATSFARVSDWSSALESYQGLMTAVEERRDEGEDSGQSARRRARLWEARFRAGWILLLQDTRLSENLRAAAVNVFLTPNRLPGAGGGSAELAINEFEAAFDLSEQVASDWSQSESEVVTTGLIPAEYRAHALANLALAYSVVGRSSAAREQIQRALMFDRSNPDIQRVAMRLGMGWSDAR